MNVNPPRSSLLARAALNSMDLVVRHWPESSRQWGQAMLAELGEISEPTAAMHWALGGLVVFSRALGERFLDWIQMPAGSGFSGTELTSNGQGPRFPKHSRLATAVVLLAAAGLLFLPIGREAVGTIKASWHGFRPTGSDVRDLEKLAAKAEKEKDARTLAFVALSYSFDYPEPRRAMEYADKAVALDPSLVWIYASHYHTPEVMSQMTERLEKLKQADPDNAFAYLVLARSKSGNGLQVKYRTPDQISEALIQNGAWKQEMDAAFRAPKFDGYFQKHEELSQETWRKYPTLSPTLIAVPLWQHTSLDFMELRTYTDLRVKQALQAEEAGNIQEAEKQLGEVVRVGKMMASAKGSEVERMFGAGVYKRGLGGFEKLYQATGNESGLNATRTQLQQVEAESNSKVQSYVGWRENIAKEFRRLAMLVQRSAILCMVLVIAVVLSLAMLEAGRIFRWKPSSPGRRTMGFVADYGPVFLLLSCGVMLWSFRPIAEAFEQYRTAEQNHSQLLGLFWQIWQLGEMNQLTYFYEPYH
ncbi:MAG TPA: hypothetical protein VMH89_04695, partial [Candidatus Acidoferrum sp.]|nr:hypothetical protein [Candidatus Acidoferrum sp.]